jgi:hypothetical protein
MKTAFLPSSAVIIICCCFSLTISSCKKTDLNTPRAELIIGSWITISDFYHPAYDADKNGTPDTEVFPLYPECMKDDLLTFKAGGIGESDEGPTVCPGSSGPPITSFTWSLFNDDNTLVMAGDSYSILELSATTLKIAYTFPDKDITYTNTYTFRKK